MGRKITTALITSTNTINFSFPYQGEQPGVLEIRRSNSGLDVMLSMKRGQFLCGLHDCLVSVRFDEGPIVDYGAAPPADHSTNLLFLRNGTAFVSHLRKSEVVRVEATFYRQGSQTFTFPVAGYKPI